MLEDFAEGPAGRKGDTMDQTIRQRVEELHSKDRHEEIVRLLERLETPDAESCSLLARAYNNLGRYEEAERLLLSAPQPEDPCGISVWAMPGSIRSGMRRRCGNLRRPSSCSPVMKMP